jgi:hypothetical protein
MPHYTSASVIEKIAPYAKAVAAVVGAFLTWSAAAIIDGGVSTEEWIALGLAILTALGVYRVPNVER